MAWNDLTEEQKRKITDKMYTCRVCRSKMPGFFRGCPSTYSYNETGMRRIRVCSEECKDKYESQFIVDEYKGQKIYCVDGKYMPYFGAEYYFTNIDDCKKRIDKPHIVPAFLVRGPFY